MEQIDLTCFLNPFTHEKTPLQVAAIGNLVDTIDNSGLTFPAGVNATILLNGEIINREEWETTFPKPGDSIIVKLIPQGGGGSKNILRAVMTVALIAGTWGVGAAWAGLGATAMSGIGATGAAASWGAFGVNTVLSYAGMLLIDKIAPLPTTATSRIKEDEPKTFGIESSTNRMNPWGAVPVLLGKHRFHPPYAAQPYSEIVGDDQYINMLFCAGYAPIYIEDLKLGNTDIDDYIEDEVVVDETNRNIEWWIHENYDSNNSTLNYFKNDIYEDTTSYELTYNNSIVLTTQPNTDEIIVDITAPNGVYGFSSSGAKTVQTVNFTIEYGNNASNNWTGGSAPINKSANNFAIPLPGNAFVVDPDADHASLTLEVTGYSYTRIGIDKTNGSWWSANSGNNSYGSPVLARKRCPNFPGYVAPICGIARSSNVASMNNSAVTDLRTDELNCGNNAVEFVPSASGNNAHIAAGNITPDTSISAASSATIRRGYRFKMNSSNTWDVRITRTTEDHDPSVDNIYDNIYCTALRSINSARNAVNMDGLCLIELRVKASEQFNGQLDDFTVLGTSICEDYVSSSETWTERPSANPAALFRYLLQGPFNKRPREDSEIDLDGLAEWYDWCVAQGYGFNLYCDYQTSLFEMLTNVAAAGRSSPTYKDGKYSIVTDKEQTTPVQHFTERNSWGFSSSKTFYEPPHAFRITMADEAQDYYTEEAFVYDDGYNSTNATLFEELKLIGCTNYDQAYKHGRFHLAQLRLRPETMKINVDLENLVCTRGDLVRVTHDVPLWGLGTGRIKSTNYNNGEISSITCDEIFSMNNNNNYAVRVRLRDGASYYSNAITVAGNNNTITFTPPIRSCNAYSEMPNGDLEIWSNGVNNNPDNWALYAPDNATVSRSNNAKIGNYSALVTNANGVRALFRQPSIHNNKGITFWRGRSISLGAWVRASNANRVCVYLYDVDPLNHISNYHSGSGNWEWLTVSIPSINNSANNIFGGLYITAGNTISAQIDGAVCVEGTSMNNTFPQTGDLLLFGKASDESVECLVKSIRPTSDLCAEIELMDYSPAVYTAESGEIPAYDTHIHTPPADIAPVISSVRSDERVMIRQGNIWSPRILVNFKPRASDRLKEISYMEGNFKVAYSKAAWLVIGNIPKSTGSVYIDNVEQGVTYWLRFRYIYKDGHAGPWCSTYSHEVVGKSGYPSDASFDDPNCEFTSNRIKFAILPITDFDLDFYEIRTDTDFGDDDGLIVRTKSPIYIYSGILAINQTYYLKACDTSGIYSLNYDSITAPSSDTFEMGSVVTEFSTINCTLTWAALDSKKLDYYQVAVYNNSSMNATNELIYTSNQFVDPHFTFDFWTNNNCSGGPYRELWFRVTAHDIYSRSAYADAYAINPEPAQITDCTALTGIKSLTITCSPLLGDVVGYQFACDTDNPPSNNQEVGTNFALFDNLTPGSNYYYRARARDPFGYSNNWSDVGNATPESVTVSPQDMDIPFTYGANWNATSGNIAWDAHTLVYKGNSYNVAAGNAGANVFVYWNAASNNNVYNNADTMPLDPGTWMLCYMNGNNAYPALQSPIIHGGLIQAGTMHANRITAGTLMIGNITGSSGTLSFTSTGNLAFSGRNFTVAAGNFIVSAANGIYMNSANGFQVEAGNGISLAGNATEPGKLRIYRSGLSGNAMFIGANGSEFMIHPTANGVETLRLGNNSNNRWSNFYCYASNEIYMYAYNNLSLQARAGAIIEFRSNNTLNMYATNGIELHGNKHSSSITNIACVATGNYAGNNGNNRLITVGFAPKYVRIIRTGPAIAQTYTYETANQFSFADGLATYAHLASAYYVMNNWISDFTSNGFIINSSGNVYSPNNNGNNYEWVAFG